MKCFDSTWKITLLFGLMLNAASCLGEIRVTDLDSALVQGGWTVSDVGNFDVVGARQRFDLNDDGIFNLEFTHTFPAETPGGMPIPVNQIIETARPALAEIRGYLMGLKEHAVDALRAGVNDPDALVAIQSEVENSLTTIQRIQELVQFGGKDLLRGDFGVWKQTNNSTGRLVSVEPSASAVPFDVTVIEPATRALFRSPPGRSRLTQNETATINGVEFRFTAGTSFERVTELINTRRHQTGVLARLTDGQELQLYTERYGESQSIELSSNSNSTSPGTLGIGSAYYAQGSEAILGTNSQGYTTLGGFVRRNDGVVVELGASSDLVSSASGPVHVTLCDGSIEFPWGTDRQQNVIASIPNLDIMGRKFQSGTSDVFLSISELDVTNGPGHLEPHIDAIQSAIDEIGQVLRVLNRFRDEPVLPAGNAESLTLNRTRVTGDTSLFAVMPGEWIGADSAWGQGVLDVAGADLDTWNQESRFYGIEFDLDGNLHYGWLEVDLTADSGIVLRRSAIELQAGRPIQAGAVPEPAAPFLLVSGLVGLVYYGRAKRRAC